MWILWPKTMPCPPYLGIIPKKRFYFSASLIRDYLSMGTAVAHGGVSTLLAFILVSFSNSYVYLTFFKVSNGTSRWCCTKKCFFLGGIIADVSLCCGVWPVPRDPTTTRPSFSDGLTQWTWWGPARRYGKITFWVLQYFWWFLSLGGKQDEESTNCDTW